MNIVVADRASGDLAWRNRPSAAKTCNTWTARLLQAAGYPVRPASALTVGTFMKQLHPYATLIQAPER
jgi:hypothetical protein